MPDWYPLIRAARYLGVPPWEMAKQPYQWLEVAIIAEAAENEAQAAKQQQAIDAQQ
jgi:hypothetical protein